MPKISAMLPGPIIVTLIKIVPEEPQPVFGHTKIALGAECFDGFKTVPVIVVVGLALSLGITTIVILILEIFGNEQHVQMAPTVMKRLKTVPTVVVEGKEGLV